MIKKVELSWDNLYDNYRFTDHEEIPWEIQDASKAVLLMKVEKEEDGIESTEEVRLPIYRKSVENPWGDRVWVNFDVYAEGEYGEMLQLYRDEVERILEEVTRYFMLDLYLDRLRDVFYQELPFLKNQNRIQKVDYSLDGSGRIVLTYTDYYRGSYSLEFTKSGDTELLCRINTEYPFFEKFTGFDILLNPLEKDESARVRLIPEPDPQDRIDRIILEASEFIRPRFPEEMREKLQGIMLMDRLARNLV